LFTLRHLPWIGVAALVVIFTCLILQYALNLPLNDDLQDILLFVVNVSAADSPASFIGPFFDQHADHMTAASRVVYYLYYLWQGEINFISLALIAQLGLISILILFYLLLETTSHKQLVFLAVCLCLINPRAYTLLVWPMAAMGFYFVYFYALAALIALNRQSPAYFLLAVICGLLATYSFSPGILIWPVGLALLLYRRWQAPDQGLSRLIMWLLLSVITLSIYFGSYHAVSGSLNLKLLYCLEHPLYTFKFFLTLLGSSFSYGNILLAQLLGGALLLGAILLSYTGLRSKLTVLHLYLWFCLLAVAMITVARAPMGQWAGFEGEPLLLNLAMVSRYAFSSMILLATLVALWANRYLPTCRGAFYSMLVLLIGLSIGNYSVYGDALELLQKERIRRFNRDGIIPVLADPVPLQVFIDKAEGKGIYTAPARPLKN